VKSATKKRSRGQVRKFFLRSALKIPYILLNNYNIETRHRFKNDKPVLHALYAYLLNIIGRELKLPVKVCESCGIIYLPDYRTWRHQKHCPYGCIAYNCRRNKQKAKQRYMMKPRAMLLASGYNHTYRQRKQNGDICAVQPGTREMRETARKMTAQIKYIYKKMVPVSDAGKIEQMDRILCELSYRMSGA
jgi:hypothetical protein